MKLRDHPLMSHRGVHSWPPPWTWVGGKENERPEGEIGILQTIRRSLMERGDRCFLYVEYEGSTYIGCLLIENPPFCRQIADLLEAHRGMSIQEIGDLDVGYLL
ncbi:MAG TPA: hypothetical protein VGL11_08480 [Candidatus Binatia bacterium]